MTQSPNPASERLGRCLVTGGAGFLGLHLVEVLSCADRTVRALDVRKTGRGAQDVESLVGDLGDPETAARAVDGVETIFHTAGRIQLGAWRSRSVRDAVFASNVTATERLLDAARRAGVKRLVHTSTAGVVQGAVAIVDGDERLPYAERSRDIYTASKIQAEKLVLAAHDGAGLATCVLRPGPIWGPGPDPALAHVLDVGRRGRFLASIGPATTRVDTSYVENLADAHVAAAERLGPDAPTGGRAYFVTDGDARHPTDRFRPIFEHLGLPFPRLRVPRAAALAVGFLCEALHFRGRRPFLTRVEARLASTTCTFDCEAARRDLGWIPRVGVAEGMRRTLPSARVLLDTLTAEASAGTPLSASALSPSLRG